MKWDGEKNKISISVEQPGPSPKHREADLDPNERQRNDTSDCRQSLLFPARQVIRYRGNGWPSDGHHQADLSRVVRRDAHEGRPSKPWRSSTFGCQARLAPAMSITHYRAGSGLGMRAISPGSEDVVESECLGGLLGLHSWMGELKPGCQREVGRWEGWCFQSGLQVLCLDSLVAACWPISRAGRSGPGRKMVLFPLQVQCASC
jgi:hypothetical protein